MSTNSCSQQFLQKHVPLSESILWNIQRRYYDTQGSKAWGAAVVPCFITSNSYIANTYARMVLSYIRDYLMENSAQIDPSEPFYVIEIGSGHGKFGFLFLREIFELREEFRNISIPIKYVMTDFTDNNVSFLQNHPTLQEYIADGRLDFARFDAENDQQIWLLQSRIMLTPNNIRNPMCMVANYLFDTLRHDCFRVVNGLLYEGRVAIALKSDSEIGLSVKSERNSLSQISSEMTALTIENSSENIPTSSLELINVDEYAAGAILEQLEAQWIFSECQTVPFVDQPLWNQVIEWYRKNCPLATFLVPVGAFRCVATLLNLSRNRLLIVSGDKGFSHLKSTENLEPPYLAIHGSFSFMVNYHALALLLQSQISAKTLVQHSNFNEGTLKLACYVVSPLGCDFPSVATTFRQHINGFGPLDFFFLQNAMKSEGSQMCVRHIMAMIRLSHYDSDTFFKFADALVDSAGTTEDLQSMNITETLDNVWKNFYHLDTTRDLPFEFGRLYFAFAEYEKALRFYIDSTLLFGPNHVTYYNIGIALYECGDLMGAQLVLQMSLDMQPSYDRSVTWHTKITEEIQLRFSDLRPFFPAEQVDLRTRIEVSMHRILPNYNVQLYMEDSPVISI